MATLTQTELANALKFANWDLPGWGRVEGLDVSLCPAAYIALGRLGPEAFCVSLGLIFPTPDYLVRVHNVLVDLAEWADKAGLLRRTHIEDTLVDLFMYQHKVILSRMPK